MKLWVILALIVLLLLLRWRRVGTLSWAFAWWWAMYALFRLGFTVPVPASVITIYMAIVSGSIFAYVSSSRERWKAFTGPLLNLILVPRYRRRVGWPASMRAVPEHVTGVRMYATFVFMIVDP